MGAYYGNANVIMDNSYSYDQVGNMATKKTLAGETQYTYDQINQLTDVITRNQREHYTYDPVGNRLERKVTSGDQAIIERYAYDNRNRMMQRDVYQEAGLSLDDTYATDSRNTQELTAQYSYDYDAQGNMLRETMFSGNAYVSHGMNGTAVDGNANTNGLRAVNTATGSHSRSFRYDAMNRLTEVTHNMHLIQRNTYDAEGLRSEMEENGRLISFLFDGDKVIAESDGTTGMKRHIRGYELVSSECEQARTYYHYTSDHLGSITDVIAPTGEVCNHYEYDAFGNFTVHNEQVENRFGYAGEQYDPATNFYYLRARFYSPVIARFIQEDSYLGDGLNLYAYVKNNPVMYVDPSGHYCEGKYETPQSGVGGEGTSGAPKKQWSTPEVETLNISETGSTGGLNTKLKWGNPKSVPTYGHTFSQHGKKLSTQQLLDRARGFENPHQVGQWLDEQQAADFLADVVKNQEGVLDVELPAEIKARSILPDGSEVIPDRAIIVIKPDGSIRTAYPYNSLYPNN